MTFADALTRCSQGLSAEQVNQLEGHYELLDRWNKVLNLTSIRSLDEIVHRHYCESLFLAQHMQLKPGETVVDVGSGAGFPGIPLAVVHADASVALVESHTRKSVFLREATRSIPNVEVIQARVESVRRHFDVLVSRAVAWADLERSARAACDRIALLVGGNDAEKIIADERFTWNTPIPLPGSENRVLLSGTAMPQ